MRQKLKYTLLTNITVFYEKETDRFVLKNVLYVQISKVSFNFETYVFISFVLTLQNNRDNCIMLNSNINEISSELEMFVDERKKIILPKFFKTGKGQYGEGDRFLGVTVPNIRSVAMNNLDAGIETVEELLESPWHEKRMCGLLIMVEQYKRTRKKKWFKENDKETCEQLRKKYFDFYLKHTDRINNWDLVDLTAPTIVGDYLIGKSHDILYKLADSTLLWNQRIAVISTFTFIKSNDFTDIYALSEKLLFHKHDLMQKAIGWMLREAGKRDKKQLMDFLDLHSHEMPRTMLRYAIEKFSEEERKHYMLKGM